jgi:rubrerythrin
MTMETSGTTRRRFLGASALLAGGAAAHVALPYAASAQDARLAQDIAVLNYALTLERLEADFYVKGLQRFSAADFSNFGITGLFDRLRDIRDHEVAHVETIASVVQSLGGAPVVGGEFAFPYTDARSFLRVAQVLENTGVSAYDGAIALIRTPQIQTAGATIATVEARHAAFLNFVNGDNPFPAATDTPRAPADIIAAIQPFVRTAPVPGTR